MATVLGLLLFTISAAYMGAVLCQQQTGHQQRNSTTAASGQHRKQLPSTAHHRDKQWLSRGQRVRMPCPKGNLQCKAVSDMMAQLEFQPGFGPKVNCTCAQFEAGVCFAPGCFPCAKSCLPKDLADLPGPLGTGLLCSSGRWAPHAVHICDNSMSVVELQGSCPWQQQCCSSAIHAAIMRSSSGGYKAAAGDYVDVVGTLTATAAAAAAAASPGCNPCCQSRGDPNKVANSTCDLPDGGCS
jgi:hypothetical protein